MLRMQLIVLTIIIAVFGIIFWFTQKSTFIKNSIVSPTPVISLPADGITPLITPTSADKQQQPAQSSEIQGPPKASMSAMLKTTKGTITISLVVKDAPNAINNFMSKAKSGYYNGRTFHRVEDWVIQGGDPKGDGTGGGAFVSELNAKPFITGAVGFAASSAMQVGQGQRVSNDSQFFIVKQDSDHLSGQYTNFGTVTEGTDVVNKIRIGDKILGITIK